MGHCVGGYADEVASGATRILSLRDKKGQSHVTVELQNTNKMSRDVRTDLPTNILQIKGKQNRAPVDAYQPYVQDLVKSGTWGEVRDLQNTGLHNVLAPEAAAYGVKPGYYTTTELAKLQEGPIRGQRGSADPELLAKIAAGTAAGAYLLSSDNAEQGLAAMGLGLALSMKGAPEAALLAAAREGGPKAQAAFTELYRQNVKQAERTLQSKFGRQNVDIEGALQDGMTSALAAVAQGTFRGDSKFSTFLHTAVVNKALNQLEAQRVRPDTVSLTEDPVTGRSGLAETLGHNETPANIALNKGLGQQIEAAMAKIDPRFREAFLAIEADGMSYEAAAEKFGVPVGTIRSRVSRAKEALQGYLRDYKDGEAGFDEAIPNRATGALGSREGGAADPRTLTAIAGVTGGAVVGSLMDPENSLRNGLYGALAGGLLGTAAGRAAMKSAIESPRNALGVISTELANIHPSLRLKLVEHEYRVLKNTEQINDQVLPFLTALKKLSKSEAQRVDNALRNGDLQELGTTPEIRKTYAGVRRALDFVEGELKALGRFGEGVSEYFPRLVKDIEGLKAAIGSAHATGLEAVLKKANAKMIKKEGRTLTDVEESIIVNRYLFAPDQTSFQPGYAKGRRLERIPDELQQFYEPSSESLLRYISGAVADIEKAKFFGRDLQTKTQGGKIFTDLDSSIGNLTARLLAEGKIDKAQAMEVRRLLKARFEQGDKAMDPRLAGVRNVTNAALLGNIASAATQIGDPLFAIYHHGLVPTLQAMTESLVGKSKVTPKQLGLINHVAEELSEMGLTGRMLHETMKWSGFKAIDMFGKETHLNAALLKWKQKLATPQGVAAFRAKYGDAFPEIDRVMQEVRNRKITPDTELLSFFELSDAQPISKAEMPAAYLNNPNGRILYQLKTYMLKQADIVRRDAYQEIAKGTPEGIMRGAKNLAALGTMYALANVPGDVIKDWLAGRPVDPLSTPKLVENVLQTFGLNRYTQDKLQRGQVAETAIGMATPPLRVLQDIAKMDARSVSYVPGAGRTDLRTLPRRQRAEEDSGNEGTKTSAA
jgi:RNA polymerase sigma-70 factor (ECF subfamily)